MREKAVAGLLFVAGLMLIVTGFPGTVGDLLAAIFAPEALILNNGKPDGGGGGGGESGFS